MDDRVLNEMLYDAQDDWLSLAGAEGSVRAALGLEPGVETSRIMVQGLAQLMADDLVIVGSVTRAHGFEPWPATDDGHLTRLRDIVAAGSSREWGYSAWFALTDRGAARALTISAPPDRPTSADGT